MIIDAASTPVKFKSGRAVYRNILSSPANPVRCVIFIVKIASSAENNKLTTVPRIAAVLLELKPPTR